jgi:hypothetical protein
MEKIFENKSLRFICNSINSGLIENEEINIDKLQISSDLNPEFSIKPIEIDLSDYIFNMVKNNLKFKTEIKQFETTFYDFVVFHIIEQDSKTLMIIGLLELILIAPTLVQGEQDRKEILTEKIPNIWDLDVEIWNLISE